MKRLLFLFLVLPVFASAEKPDFLLITIDTLRADHLGSYGHQTIRTPNLDALAGKALFFQNAISPAPLTLPSHVSLMTGRYPVHHGIHDNAGVVNPTELTLAEILRAQGYHTYAFIGGFPLDHRFGLDQGFEVYDDIFPRQRNRSLDFRSERSAEEVVKAVVQTPVKSPFFVWVHFYDPHAPYTHGGYRGEIEFVDRQIGVLLRKLQTSRTVIAVAGDHGESLGDHGELTHRIFVYDSTMKVPLWISGPGFKAQKISTQVRLIDLFPTILNSFKIVLPDKVDGVVLPEQAGRTAYIESKFPQLQLGWSDLAGIRTDEWKFIRSPKPELYDLKKDPGERTNVFATNKDLALKLEQQIPVTRGSVSEAPQISAELKEQLQSLGYVGSGAVSKESNIDPKDRIAVWNQIEKAVDLESTKPVQSVLILEQALKKDPQNPMILGFLAQKYAEASRIDEAKSILRKVLARDPENSLALYRMASLSLKTGETAEAKKHAESLRQLEKGNADALILLARANLASGDFEQASENLKSALQIDARDLDLRNDLGNLYLQNKQTEKAREQFQIVAAADPKNLQALNGLAMCLFTEGNWKASETKLKGALQIAPSDAQTKMNLALLYAKQQKKMEAMALYREVLSSPETPSDWKEEASRRLQQLQ